MSKKPIRNDHEILNMIDKTEPVFCYRNLHSGMWSVKQRGIVLCHSSRIYLRDCEFKVNLNGNRRVRELQRKEVHAYVKGYVMDPMRITAPSNYFSPIQYNPYEHESFMMTVWDHQVPVKKAWIVNMNIDRPVKVRAIGVR